MSPAREGGPPAANVWLHSHSEPPRPVADVTSGDPDPTGGGQRDVRCVLCGEGSRRTALGGWSLPDYRVSVENAQIPGPSSLSPAHSFSQGLILTDVSH